MIRFEIGHHHEEMIGVKERDGPMGQWEYTNNASRMCCGVQVIPDSAFARPKASARSRGGKKTPQDSTLLSVDYLNR